MMFTSAARRDDAEGSSDTFCGEGTDLIDGAVLFVISNEGEDGTIFFTAMLGAEAVCIEVVATTFVMGSVEEAAGKTIGEVRKTVVLPKKIAIKMTRASAATMPRYGERRGMFIRYPKNGILALCGRGLVVK